MEGLRSLGWRLCAGLLICVISAAAYDDVRRSAAPAVLSEQMLTSDGAQSDDDKGIGTKPTGPSSHSDWTILKSSTRVAFDRVQPAGIDDVTYLQRVPRGPPQRHRWNAKTKLAQLRLTTADASAQPTRFVTVNIFVLLPRLIIVPSLKEMRASATAETRLAKFSIDPYILSHLEVMAFGERFQ
jgi:hypothetical protein